MFSFLKKSSSQAEAGTTKSWSLSGLHCSSCAVNIDMTLEDLAGVKESKTNYAKSAITVKYDPGQVKPEKIVSEIKKLGYQVKNSD